MAVKNELYIFYFHDVSNDDYIPARIRTDPKRFIKEIQFICRNFEVISISQALDQLKNKLELGEPWPRPTAVVCFDDGFRSFLSIAFPVLVKLRCPAALFVNGAFCAQQAVSEALIINKISTEWHAQQILDLFPDYDSGEPLSAYTTRNSCRKQFERLNLAAGKEILDRRPYLSFDELIKLPEDIVTIGNHTLRHLFLSNISAAEQESEICENHSALEHLPAYRPIICLPFGSDASFNGDTCALLRKHGNGLLMKAVGGTSHRIRDDLIEVERIGLNNNKLPIKHHIKQRTGESVVIPILRQKLQYRLALALGFNSSNLH